MVEHTQLKLDLIEYSLEISKQFTDYKRQEFLSKEKAFDNFIDKFLEVYGTPDSGIEGIRLVLYGEASIPYEACISSCNKFNHCPIVGVFSSLMNEDLRPAMINLSNQVISQAIS